MTATQKHDVVDLLMEQHEHIRELFASVEEAASSSARQQSFEELRRYLAVHETAEELITHPVVRTADGGNPVVDARLEEETESKKLLAALDGMDVDDPAFAPRLSALKEAVLAHADAEEKEEFTLLRNSRDTKLLERMATAVLAVEAIAPTHPHPSVGSSMTTNLMAGPIASVIDRTRDAVRAALG